MEDPQSIGLWRRLRSNPGGRFLLRLVFYGLALFVAIPYALSSVLLRAQRRPVSPPERGFQLIHVVSQGLKLRAWLNPCVPTGRPALVIAHGLDDSLESYVTIGQAFRRRGHSVLLLDLRGHGGSEGRYTTLGGLEREDVRAAMRSLDQRHLAEAGYILLGVSMGGVAALRAAADRLDVRAVVAEAPFDTYRDTVAHHAWLYYRLPHWVPWIPLSIAFAEWRAGFDADSVDALAAARQTRAPLLLIADAEDPRMPEGVVRRVLDAHPGPKRLWVCPGADHAGAANNPDYLKNVIGFLKENDT
jgi:hypothetical protein